jgi:rhodanese-related sulfurtransferase
MAKHAPEFLAIVNDARSRIAECSVADVNDWQTASETFRLVDVREESEWSRGHLPGAKHLGKGIIERDVEEQIPDQAAKIVLYCGGGYRSALAADNLQKMGYTNVTSMDGGFRGWKEAGLEIIQP